MKKVGFLAVSLVALMAVGSAYADIASTTFVAGAVAPKEDVANKATDTYTTGSTTQYPSVKAAENIAKTAASNAASSKLNGNQGSTNVNKVMVVNSAGAITPSTIKSANIDAAAGITKGQLAADVQTSLGKADAAAPKADLTAETTARTNADKAINDKIGTVPADKTVVEMIEDAQTEATYDDTAVKASITAINNSEVMKSGATKAKIDAIATNTSNITALQSGKQDKLGYTAENSANKTATIAAAATASDTKYPTEKAVATALAGKQAAGDYATNTALNAVKTTAETANTQATTNKGDISTLKTDVANLKSGTDLPIATSEKLGAIKSGGNITVNSTTGAVTVNQAAKATTADSATKATQDASGNVITATYATKSENNAKMATTAYNTATTVAADGTYVKKTNTVAANLTALDTATKAAKDQADKGVADAATAKSAAATADGKAVAAQGKADDAFDLASAAIPKPSGTCTDCVLKYNGTAFSWEEIGR